jgi:hypothetical protein
MRLAFWTLLTTLMPGFGVDVSDNYDRSVPSVLTHLGFVFGYSTSGLNSSCVDIEYDYLGCGGNELLWAFSVGTWGLGLLALGAGFLLERINNR